MKKNIKIFRLTKQLKDFWYGTGVRQLGTCGYVDDEHIRSVELSRLTRKARVGEWNGGREGEGAMGN